MTQTIMLSERTFGSRIIKEKKNIQLNQLKSNLFKIIFALPPIHKTKTLVKMKRIYLAFHTNIGLKTIAQQVKEKNCLRNWNISKSVQNCEVITKIWLMRF